MLSFLLASVVRDFPQLLACSDVEESSERSKIGHRGAEIS